MSRILNKAELTLILTFSVFALISAFFIEYVLGHEPCNLCLLQRLPYLGVILAFLFIFFIDKFERKFFFIASLFFLISLILSIYHVGIEQGIIQESFVCSLEQNINSLSKEDILKSLKNKPVSCKDVNFTIFGLSLATINTFASITFTAISFKVFLKYEKK
tara:strand:+ start:2393 stop:2875 length:483 start_codon:yes stop_codon:yes gene_type:complete